jgi:transposase-like protein
MMPDRCPDRHKPPLPKVLTVAEFAHRFTDEAACVEHLRNLRWGPDLERFACPRCGHGRGWWLSRRQLVECGECHHQTSVTAGTVFHRLRSPLWKWFWAVYQLAQDKKGVAALELAKQIGVSYATAWLMLHKLRRAMRRANQAAILEGLVEVDETYIGGSAEDSGTTGRGAASKTPVAVALELEHGKPRRVALRRLERVDGHCLRRFARAAIRRGSTLRTDGWGSYRRVVEAGYGHEEIVTGGGKKAIVKFPWLHTFVGNLKRMILGTYHSASPQHLDGYLAEFAFRANHRWQEASLFDCLLRAATNDKAVTYRQLVTGGS